MGTRFCNLLEGPSLFVTYPQTLTWLKGLQSQDDDWDLEMLREQQEMIERECRLKYQLELDRERDRQLKLEQVTQCAHALNTDTLTSHPHPFLYSPAPLHPISNNARAHITYASWILNPGVLVSAAMLQSAF